MSTLVKLFLEVCGHDAGICGGKANQLVAIAQDAPHEGRMIGGGKVLAQELSASLGVDFKQIFERSFGFGCINGNAVKRSGLDGLL